MNSCAYLPTIFEVPSRYGGPKEIRAEARRTQREAPKSLPTHEPKLFNSIGTRAFKNLQG